jgi:putative membrane-bound dehydrogenase-like protein
LVVALVAWIALASAPRATSAPQSPEPARPAATAPSFEQLLPRLKPLAPDEALRSFQIAPGFKVEIAAAEPLITDPVDAAWDEDGRLYVCELWNYPYVPKPGEPLGRVRLIEDTDGDGRYDRGTVFADEVMWPSGVACWDGGVFVLSSPDLLYLKDTDGDGKADVRRKVLTGFRGQSYEVPNCIRWGPDNLMYVAGSYAGGSIRPADIPEAMPVEIGRGKDLAFDPNSRGYIAVAGSGEWGNTFDDWGERFVCNATTPVIHPVVPLEYLDQSPYFAAPQISEQPFGEWSEVYGVSAPEPWKAVRQKFWNRWKDTTRDMNAGRFPPKELAPHGYSTSAAGVTAYRGSAYGEAYRDNLFFGEPANNVVVRLALKADGAGLTAYRPGGLEKKEFLASTDTWFRPVNFVNGPDGCLYVLDLYREVVEDESAIPEDIVRHLDLNSGRDRGRIYRIVPENSQRERPPRLRKAKVEELVAALDHPDAWWRETAQRLIYQRQDKDAVGPLRRLAAQAKLPQGRIHALWALQGLLSVDDATVLAALADKDPHVRGHALRLAERRVKESEELKKKLLAAADDTDARVRFQAALSLSFIRDDEAAAKELARIARRDMSDDWTRTAVLLASSERAALLFRTLASDPTFAAGRDGPEFLGRLAQIAGARGETSEVSAVLQVIAGPILKDRPVVKREALAGLSGGLQKQGSSLGEHLRKAGQESGEVGAAVERLFADARQTASEPGKEVAERVEAIGLLAHAPFDTAAETLASLLDPAQPQGVQVAAVRALAARTDGGTGKMLVQRWRSLAPGVRAEAAEALFRRPQRLAALLDAVEAGTIRPAELEPARRQALLKHADAVIRARAEKLLGRPPAPDRQKVVDRYAAAVAKADADAKRGAEVYQKNCAVCHQQDAARKNAAPNLATLQDRSPGTLLVAILDPNRAVQPNYVAYTLATRDGQDYTGVIVGETASAVTLRRAGGEEDTILRGNIVKLTSTGLSLMPEGFESGIDEHQMADLVRHVQELRP